MKTLLETLTNEMSYADNVKVTYDEFLGRISVDWESCALSVYPHRDVAFACDTITPEDATLISSTLTVIANTKQLDFV